jgi:hypothetical protein
MDLQKRVGPARTFPTRAQVCAMPHDRQGLL